jgi:hypothetical protein
MAAKAIGRLSCLLFISRNVLIIRNFDAFGSQIFLRFISTMETRINALSILMFTKI